MTPQEKAVALKDIYISSVHDDLNNRKRGVINDGDESHYIYKDGETIRGPYPGGGMPLEGEAPGEKILMDLEGEYLQDSENIMQDYMQRNVYGTGGFA